MDKCKHDKGWTFTNHCYACRLPAYICEKPKSLRLTEFEAKEVMKALKKRSQVLRAARRRGGEEDDLFQKQVAVDGLIAVLSEQMKET